MMVRELSSSGSGNSGSRSLDRALQSGSPGGSSTSSSASSSSLSLQGRFTSLGAAPADEALAPASTASTLSVAPPSVSPAPSADHLPDFFHHNPEHCAASFAAINKMRQNSQLCDVALKVSGEVVPAHKVILASVSPYFHAMFNDDLAEKSQSEVTLHDVDLAALQLLVDFAYSGHILITEDNVQILLPASSLLQMASVREACCKFLMRQLHPSNCLGIRSFADAHSCKELHRRSHRFALQNFQEVITTEEFLLLPFNEVEQLISSNQLNISSEEKVFHAVLTWVKHDLSDREQHISKLMKHVRLPLVAREFLTTAVDSEALVRKDAECRELLLEAMKYHLLPEQRAALASSRTQQRRPDGARPYLFAVGGGSLFAIHSECECYNPRTDRWMPVAPMLYRRSRSGVTALGRLLYVVGGYDGATDLASVESYNPSLNKWASVTPMGTKRSCLGICSLDGLLYVCGGYDGASCLSSMERYDPLTGVWSSCPAMATRRRYCRVSALGRQVHLLAGRLRLEQLPVERGAVRPARRPVGAAALDEQPPQQLRRRGPRGQPLLRRRQRRHHVHGQRRAVQPPQERLGARRGHALEEVDARGGGDRRVPVRAGRQRRQLEPQLGGAVRAAAQQVDHRDLDADAALERGRRRARLLQFGEDADRHGDQERRLTTHSPHAARPWGPSCCRHRQDHPILNLKRATRHARSQTQPM